MRKLLMQEVVAMWHFHDRYAAQRGSAIDFWMTLPEQDKRFIWDMLTAIQNARDEFQQAKEGK